MAKKQITLEGIIDTIRKKISKSIDNKLAKKIDSILESFNEYAKKSNLKNTKIIFIFTFIIFIYPVLPNF